MTPVTCRCWKASRPSASGPGMYIGSTDGRGLMHCLWEIIDNSVDEALTGHGHRIEVVLHADGSVEVCDDGRGIPVDVEPKTGLTGVEVVMTKLHAGGKFGGGSYAASGGLHGVGASVVNALSSRLDVEVDRDGLVHVMSFRRGVPGVFDGPAPESVFTESTGLRIIGKVVKKKTGTRTRFWPDRADLHARRRHHPRRAARPRAADRLPRPWPRPWSCATSATVRGRRADLPLLRRHQRVLRVPRPRRGGHRHAAAARHGPLPRDRARPRRAGPHDLQGGRARAHRRRRAALGGRLRHDGPVLRQHHRDPEGRHARPRFRAGHARDAQRAAAGSAGAAGSRGRRRPPTTSSRG